MSLFYSDVKWHEQIYHFQMNFDWNDDKNAELKSKRHISFERIVVAIEEGKLLDVLEHSNKQQ